MPSTHFFSLLLARLLSSAKEILNMPNKKRGYTWLSSSFMFYALSLFLVALCFCFWSFIRSKQLYDTPFDSNALPQIVRVNRYWWTLRRKGFFCSYPRKRERDRKRDRERVTERKWRGENRKGESEKINSSTIEIVERAV